MLGLKTSPNITRFANHHGVTRTSVVSSLTNAFGNHPEILTHANALIDDQDNLRLAQDDVYLDFDVKEIAMPVIIDQHQLSGAIGVLEGNKKSANMLYLLVEIND